MKCLAQPIKRRDIVLVRILSTSVASIVFGAIYIGGLFANLLEIIQAILLETPITTALTPILSLTLSSAIGVVYRVSG